MKYMLWLYADESEAAKTPEKYQAAAQAWCGFSRGRI